VEAAGFSRLSLVTRSPLHNYCAYFFPSITTKGKFHILFQSISKESFIYWYEIQTKKYTRHPVSVCTTMWRKRREYIT
jgi:hypothetical protein